MKVDGKKISILQAQKQMTTTKLAKLSGISGSAICNIVRGDREPRPKTVGKLAKALNVEVEELLIQE